MSMAGKMIILKPPDSERAVSRQDKFCEGKIKRGSPPNGGADARRKQGENAHYQASYCHEAYHNQSAWQNKYCTMLGCTDTDEPGNTCWTQISQMDADGIPSGKGKGSADEPRASSNKGITRIPEATRRCLPSKHLRTSAKSMSTRLSLCLRG